VPALRGSLTYARFFVEGELPDDFRERFMKSIRLRAMKPLEPDDEDLERSGWCAVGDPFALDLTYDEVFFNEYLNLGLRTDRWVLPGSVLRANLKDAEAAYLQKKGRERLTRKERAELKELVARKLRRKSAPATRAVDVSWSLNDGLLRFFSHAPKAAGRLAEVFQKTFGGHGLTLIAESPYTLAERMGLSRAQKSAWQELDATSLGEEEDEDGA
jgi:recombination associated protein RdgC